MNKKGIIFVPNDMRQVEWIDKIRSAGLNTLGVHSGGGEAHDVITELGEFARSDFRCQAAAAGLELEYELHAAQNLLPDALYETHPEYFIQTLRSQRRVKDHNWCISSAGTLKVVADNAAELVRKLPSTTNRYYLWGCDVEPYACWCHCNECARFSFSEQQLVSVNAMAERLPEAEFSYLAYYKTMETPRAVKPRSNVFCEFAPYHRSYDYAINDSRCAVNRSYVKSLLNLLECFSPEKMQILEYWLDASLWGNADDPPQAPFLAEIAEADIKFYTGLGIKNITTFAVNQNGRYMEKFGDTDFWKYAEIINRYL